LDDNIRSQRDNFEFSTVPAQAVASIALFAVARGVSMAEVTAATGLTGEDFVDPEARVPSTSIPALWTLLGERCPGQAITLHMVAAAPPSALGVLAHAAQFAPDLRAALNLLVRYRCVWSPRLDMEVREAPVATKLILTHPVDKLGVGYAGEMGLALAARFFFDVLDSRETLIRVEFAHTPYAPLEQYVDYFRAPVVFGAPNNALILKTSSLATPVPRSNAHLLKFIQGHLDLVRERLEATTNQELARIRAAIGKNAERGEFGGQALAKQLGVGLRTLQRQARDLGTSVRELIDEVRLAQARELLADSKISLTEVGFLLGYATESSFRRAFKRWTGNSPADARRRHR